MSTAFHVSGFVRTLELAHKAQNKDLDDFLIQGLQDGAVEGEPALDALCKALDGRSDLVSELVDLVATMEHDEACPAVDGWVRGSPAEGAIERLGCRPLKESHLAFSDFANGRSMEYMLELHIPFGKDVDLFHGVDVRFYGILKTGLRFLWDRISISTDQTARVAMLIGLEFAHTEIHRRARDSWPPDRPLRFHPELHGQLLR